MKKYNVSVFISNLKQFFQSFQIYMHSLHTHFSATLYDDKSFRISKDEFHSIVISFSFS